MRLFFQEEFTFAQRLADEADFSMLKITKSAMDDAGGAAGGSGREVVLFDQQDALAVAGTLPRDGRSVDTAANNDDVEVPAVEGRTHAVDATCHDRCETSGGASLRLNGRGRPFPPLFY